MHTLTGRRKYLEVTPDHFIREIAALHSLLAAINGAYPLCVTQYLAPTSYFNPFSVLYPLLTLYANDTDG